MEYYFDQLDPIRFQRLINAILVARFGEDARLTPLRGQDGGRDGETAPGHPYFAFQVSETTLMPQGIVEPPRKGRYLFQVKHHRTTDRRLSDARQAVIADFAEELKTNVLKRKEDEQVNYFFLITNVPSSKDAIDKLDRVRHDLLRNVQSLHADVWWQERVVSYLDRMPSIWNSFPEIFAGGVVPFLAKVVNQTSEGLPRALRLAIDRQYEQDRNVKFRQIELEQDLSKLFVNLDVDIRDLPEEMQQKLMITELRRYERLSDEEVESPEMHLERQFQLRSARSRYLVSALGVLLDDDQRTTIRKLVLEGGPGQGKSTITQVAVQIYRQQILAKDDMDPQKRWLPPEKFRLPFRIELRRLAEWLNNNPGCSVEKYLALTIKQDSGGNEISVDDIHTTVEKSPVLLIFDGLDEIGSDRLRDDVLKAIMDCTHRFESGLQADLRVVITTRPPAIAGRRENLIDFERLSLAPMERDRIEDYVTRWLSVQIRENEERQRIQESFDRRQDEPHVEALARNPMQLSVLLQFIRLKGEAFPDRRAELYRDYFQIVIDRDVEKSPELRENRDVIEALHAFLGYKIHALTEVNQANRTLNRRDLLSMVEEWLRFQGHEPEMAQEFFKLGEERFGLIVASRGEGEETKYGYEVQPIQEYFAAAFISNQVSASSAHEVFETIIRRPYWKEVALFLAGLRRPNEKADLVARAKRIDQDKKLGWRQDGRAVVLQLLQEGVFSEPRYVFSQALDFVLDLLDTKRMKVQREPPNLHNALAALVKRNPSEEHQERMLQLLRDYSTCEDRYVMMRLYRVASQLLQPDDFTQTVLSYRGNCPDLVALVRLGWPYSWEVDMQQLTRDSSFWQGVPDSTWAETWWREALRGGSALDLPASVHVHQRLVERFATDPTGVFFYTPRKQPFLETLSKLAVWRMLRYQQMLQVVWACKSRGETAFETMREEIVSICKDEFDIDYAGLEEPIRGVIRNVIELSHSLLIASCNGEGKESSTLMNYVQGIKDYLQYPGLVSWLACQCAMDIVQGMLVGSAEFPSPGTLPSIIEREDLLSLVEDLRPFYEDATAEDWNNSKWRSETQNFFLNRFGFSYFFHPYRTEVIPRCIRLEPRGKPVAVVDLLAESVCSGSDLPFEWMRNMSFSSEIMRPLVEKCRDHLPNLLVALSEFRFARIGVGPPLRVQDTQRILKVARNTDDPKTLAGAATALVSASFLRIAKPSLILKLVRFDSSGALASILFRVYKKQTEDRDLDSLKEEIRIVEEIAEGVFSVPDEYPFRTVCQAADFLAEHNQIDSPPLLYEEEKLGIKLQSLSRV